MSVLKIIGSVIVGAILFGMIGIQACGRWTPTSKFCGLMVIYTAPIGAIVGAIAGFIWASRGSKNP